VKIFKPKELANTAWAFEIASQWDKPLFTALGLAAAEQHIVSFNPPDLVMVLHALLQCERLRIAWRLFEHADNNGHCFSPLCLATLFMECEQRGFLEREISCLRRLTGFRLLAKHVAAIRLANTNQNELQEFDVHYEVLYRFDVHGKCWMACFTEFEGRYTKELELLANVSASVHSGDAFLVCNVIEEFGEDVFGLA